MLRVTVAMLTYHRPDDLRATLPLLLDQVREVSAPGDVAADLLVVDNDPQGDAGPVVAAHAGPQLRYVVEPTPGIAAARNRALDEVAGSDLVVFIDDDERPRPGWLRHLLATHHTTGATAVAGPVVSTFVGELHPWVAAGAFFTRRRLPTGTPIDVAATNNLLIDLRPVRTLGLRFDPRFGLSGADDTLFTRTLARRGGVMAWCDEAVVTDAVPAARMTRSWVLRRAFSSGNSWGLTSAAIATTRGQRCGAFVRTVLRASARVTVGTARAGLGVALRSPHHQTRGLRTLARGAGMIVGSANVAYQEYGREAAGRRRGVGHLAPRWARHFHRVRSTA